MVSKTIIPYQLSVLIIKRAFIFIFFIYIIKITVNNLLSTTPKPTKSVSELVFKMHIGGALVLYMSTDESNKTVKYTGYFKIIYLHIIGMKTGGYTSVMALMVFHIETFSLYRNHSFNLDTWINILVNKYISDLSLY